MSCYWFNKQDLLQKAKEKYGNGGKEKAAKYYQLHKDVIKEKARDKYKKKKKKKKNQKGNIPKKMSIETCQKRKRIKKGNIKKKNTK